MHTNYRILFVDDDADFRAQMTEPLRQAGYTVVEAEGEKQAEQLVAQESFDLAVVNLFMEAADSGFRLCYHLKKKFPQMATILCSAINSENGISFTMESEAERNWLKADSFLNKPVRFEQMLAEIESLLKH